MHLLVACTPPSLTPAPPTAPAATGQPTAPAASQVPADTQSPPATDQPAAARLLTICMTGEPDTLFLYYASSAAKSILQAVYDGPFDVQGGQAQAVILTGVPTQANGSALLQAVQVQPGELIVDAAGNLTALGEGVRYHPSGCSAEDCALVYSGTQPVSMDQRLLRFSLLPGLTWSDGAPLTADDSVYSYELARSLLPGLLERVERTAAYTALDATTVEWRGVPGFQGAWAAQYFFSPLPRHAWGSMTAAELLSANAATQTPLGWGPYVIQEWVRGDHITLARNENYFRAAEGLPNFDHLVYRFVSGSQEALDALLVGECDLVDTTATYDADLPALVNMQTQGRLALAIQPDTALELLMFGVDSYDEARPNLFALREVRQAVAQCIDRQALVDDLLLGLGSVAQSYLPARHPLFAADAPQYAYDPQAAADLLQSAGWLDVDGDPATARLSQGVAGIPDGTAFEFTYLVSSDAERTAAAQRIQADLAACGLDANLLFAEPADYLAAGPAGEVFGRSFDAAQFALQTASEPPCALFLTREIPGPYPEFALGWGGANAAGYSSPEYDQACWSALTALPETPAYASAHQQAQTIFAEDLPALPLYWRYRAAVTRPDLCGLSLSGAPQSMLWNLEGFQVGEACRTP